MIWSSEQRTIENANSDPGKASGYIALLLRPVLQPNTTCRIRLHLIQRSRKATDTGALCLNNVYYRLSNSANDTAAGLIIPGTDQ